MAQRLKTDWILFITVIVMVSFGLLMVYSASSVLAQVKYGSIWYFAKRQAWWAAIAVLAMMTLKRTNYTRLQSPAVAFTAMGLALALLIAVLAADTADHRWLRFGPFSLQPSELAKPALVVFLAFFVTWRKPAINTRYTLVPAALVVGFVLCAVALPDLGTAFVMGVCAAAVFVVAGLKPRYCAITGVLAMIGVCGFIAHKPYRVARVVRFFDPQLKLVDRIDSSGWVRAYLGKSTATSDTNYQARMARIAIGAGGPGGAGLMEGKQKLLYLPEPHTDFIFAVAAEELGFPGAMGILGGFMILFWRGLRVAWRMHDDFGRYLALGITVMIAVQALTNITVALGLVPTKGITLPMISAGGSSLLSTLALLGMLMNVSEHTA